MEAGVAAARAARARGKAGAAALNPASQRDLGKLYARTADDSSEEECKDESHEDAALPLPLPLKDTSAPALACQNQAENQALGALPALTASASASSWCDIQDASAASLPSKEQPSARSSVSLASESEESKECESCHGSTGPRAAAVAAPSAPAAAPSAPAAAPSAPAAAPSAPAAAPRGGSLMSDAAELAALSTLCNSVWALASRAAPDCGERLFSVSTVPKLSLAVFMQRCVDYVNQVATVELERRAEDASASHGMQSLVIALVYLDRLVEQRGFTLTPANAHRALLTCFVVATKTWRDKPIPNSFMAKVGGIGVQELNQFELDLCTRLAFRLYVPAAEFQRTLRIVLASTS